MGPNGGVFIRNKRTLRRLSKGQHLAREVHTYYLVPSYITRHWRPSCARTTQDRLHSVVGKFIILF